MSEFILQHEPTIRLIFFLSIFAIMAAWEIKAPRRSLTQSKLIRWGNNIGIVALNSLILRWLFPAAAVGVAVFAQQQGWGLLNYFDVPIAVSIILSVILLDCAIYLQHVMFHAIPAFWRLHRMHHTDMDFDVTTGARFHPIEIVLSMLIKFAVIITLGTPALAVLIFEILLNGTAMFNHSNIKLPEKIDALLRKIIVTPDMHRVHHSIIAHEANSNFGFNLSIWDQLFGTYIAQPQTGHTDMKIGIEQFQDKKFLTLPWMLIQPFIGKVRDYVINRRTW